MKTIYLNVKGRVQGVYYRKSTQNKAEELGITGTVQNLSNGDVAIIAQGSEERIEIFVNWCWNGPMLADVTDIQIKETNGPLFDSFNVLR